MSNYKKIALDVGHARHTGAAGNGLQEHEVAASLAKQVKRILAGQWNIHAEIIDFPELSNKGDLAAAIKAINAGNYDAVVSLHCDSSGNSSARGAHVIYKTLAGYALAAEIADRLTVHLPGRAEKTVKRNDLAILNQTRPPAVLVECGFVSSPVDAAILKSRPVLLASAIAAGVVQWCSPAGSKKVISQALM